MFGMLEIVRANDVVHRGAVALATVAVVMGCARSAVPVDDLLRGVPRGMAAKLCAAVATARRDQVRLSSLVAVKPHYQELARSARAEDADAFAKVADGAVSALDSLATSTATLATGNRVALSQGTAAVARLRIAQSRLDLACALSGHIGTSDQPNADVNDTPSSSGP